MDNNLKTLKWEEIHFKGVSLSKKKKRNERFIVMLYPKTIKNRVRRLARLRHEKSNIKIRRNAIRCQKKISKQNNK
jgi:hypothetical protein